MRFLINAPLLLADCGKQGCSHSLPSRQHSTSQWLECAEKRQESSVENAPGGDSDTLGMHRSSIKDASHQLTASIWRQDTKQGRWHKTEDRRTDGVLPDVTRGEVPS